MTGEPGAADGEAAELPPWDYAELKEVLRDEPLPAMVVDLDRFDANVRQFSQQAALAGKTIRVASKSLRVPTLIRRVLSAGGPAARGVMCFSVPEAALLAADGFNDLLVAYPTCQRTDVAAAVRLANAGTVVTLMVDAPQHVQWLAATWRELGAHQPLRLCVEADVSWRPLGLHIGAQRSPVRTLADFDRVVGAILADSTLELAGVMAYEAHLAGVPDASPFHRLGNFGVRLMKWFAGRDVVRKRESLHKALERKGVELEFFNGSGTGWFGESLVEPWLSEITVGSGFLQSHLFGYYRDVDRQPAFCFALQVTRIPQANRVTCQGGGFIASGPPGLDRAPIPFLPAGLKVDPREGCGEVQTPLIVPEPLQGQLRPGDPVLFRPAKAGEIAEHFTDYLLLRQGKIVERAKTYRGLGGCFH